VTLDLRDGSLPASAVIRALDLAPHPEGGHYRETWRDPDPPGGRGAGTSILFLLAASERSHWHRVDAAELWLWQAGASLALRISSDGRTQTTLRLGPDQAGGAVLQGLVPRDAWQAATSEGAWTLCACVVTPAFRFAGFELAPPAWEPG
jgi:uncharacterized protein